VIESGFPIPTGSGATLESVVEDRHRIAKAADQRRARLNQRLRQAFINGAVEDSRRGLGRMLP
jgi:hypothetical protein